MSVPTRDGFRDIASGWTMDGFDRLTDRIEELAEWTKVNGPLNDTESKTVAMMIQRQIAIGEDYP